MTCGSATSPTWATPAPTVGRAASTCSCRRAMTGSVPDGYFVFRVADLLELGRDPRPRRAGVVVDDPHLSAGRRRRPARDRVRGLRRRHRSTASTPTTSASSRRSTRSSRRNPKAHSTPNAAGQLAALGIVHGQPFEPDDPPPRHPRAGRAESVAGLARTLLYKPRDPRTCTSSRTARGRPRSSAAATSSSPTAPGCSTTAALMHYVGTGITPAMTHAARRHRLAVRLHRRRRQRRHPRRRQGLHPHPARTDPGQDVLGHRHLRHPDPLTTADRQPVPERQQPLRRPAHREPTATSSSASAPTAAQARRELAANDPRQELVPDPAPLRTPRSRGSTRPGAPVRSSPPDHGDQESNAGSRRPTLHLLSLARSRTTSSSPGEGSCSAAALPRPSCCGNPTDLG